MSKSLDLSKLCQQAVEVILDVGEFIRSQKGRVGTDRIVEKSKNSLVSYVDQTAEEKLVQGLGTLLEEPTFLTEEGTVIARKGTYRWIIDPLDGTTNFLHRIPAFSVSVGLEVRDELVLGIVYEVNQDECFYAWKGGGAYLNGNQIGVSPATHLSDALLATGFPYYDYSLMQKYLGTLQELMKDTRGIRRLGSAAVDLAYVACGRFEGFFEYSLHPWDVAGGVVLVQEAGGLVTDFKGGADYLFGGSILAASPAIHQAMLDVLIKHFQD
ncbi:MAG: inositol monophosphatase family protein [Bacteroidota bacterium]